ncbi:AMP-binding protein [Streptomyces sp. NPDC021100]|uniref:AMP-binding protein n=1 Tax=Streptomyces sp. NPDC021100 TaxID=3365114 RepID=UPI003794DF42
MSEPQDVARTEWCVVLNGEGQYAIWPAARELPAGWRAEGVRGERERCLARVQEVWTDPRPVGLRHRVAEGVSAGGVDVVTVTGRQARRVPEAEALCGEGFALTFRELDAASNRWARYLRSLGVGRGAVVGVLLGPGAELHAVTLGVWKAGAGCLPLEPESPAVPLCALLGAAGARFLVTEMPYAAAGFGGQVRYADDPEVCGALARLSDEPLGRTPDPEDVAYVMRVPSAAGPPLAVAVPHRGLAHHLASVAGVFAGAGDGGTAVFAPVASEGTVAGLWAPLWAGRRVLLAPRALDPVMSAAWLSGARSLSALMLTAHHLRLLLEQLGPTAGAELARRFVVTGGASGPAAARLAGLLGSGRLCTAYGAAETSFGPLLPPGQADGDTRMRVLDDDGLPVPDGAVGELYVAGPGVARGYVGRAALTAQRFVPDPYGPAGTRMYRTGELAHRTSAGEVRLLGRTDRQVWARGHRVDPAETEEALHDHPGVAEAVVDAEDVPGDVRLAAYVVPRPGAQGLDPAALAAHCGRRLPAALVPTSITLLDEVPRGADGRVERSALPGRTGGHGQREPGGRGSRAVPGKRLFPGGSGLVESLAAHRVPGACFAFLEGGRLVAVEAAGSDGAGRPITPRTAFPAGRLSRHVAALGALRLVDQGLLALDAEAGRAGDAPVTLADLLCRRGTDIGAALLPALLEHATGEVLGPLLRRLVLGPLGLDGSRFGGPPVRSGGGSGAPVARVGHDAAGRALHGVRWAVGPSQLWTTAPDLAKVALELRRSLRGGPCDRDTAARGAALGPDGLRALGAENAVHRADEAGDLVAAPPGYYAASVFCARADRGLVVLANGNAGGRVSREIVAGLNERTSYDGGVPDGW